MAASPETWAQRRKRRAMQPGCRGRDRFLGRMRPGMVFRGRVRKVAAYGAVVALGHGTEGVIHRSAADPSRFWPGQYVWVRVLAVDGERVELDLAFPDSDCAGYGDPDP